MKRGRVGNARSCIRGRSPMLAAFAAFAGPLDLLTRFASRGSLVRRLAEVDGQIAQMCNQAPDIAVVLTQEGDELVALFQ